jgi:hypothetical protein
MAIEDLKRWHWCVIGLLVGAAVAAITLSMDPPEPKGITRVAANVFEEQWLAHRDPEGQWVYKIENVRIHPSKEIPVPGEKSANVESVTYDLWVYRDSKHAEILPREMHLKWTGTKPSLVAPLDGMSLKDYFAKLNDLIAHPEQLKTKLESTKPKPNAANPKAKQVSEFGMKWDQVKPEYLKPITYKFAWIETPKGAYSVFTAGGLVVIGLIWPTIVQLLVAGGFGRVRDEKDEYDLARHKSVSGPTAAEKNRAVVTEEDMDKLAQLEAEMEAKLKSGATDADRAPKPAAQPAKPVVPVLAAGPLEAPKEDAKPKFKPKGFGTDQGDYYPTEVHGKKT